MATENQNSYVEFGKVLLKGEIPIHCNEYVELAFGQSEKLAVLLCGPSRLRYCPDEVS
jgi:hypothetical protein